MDIRVAMENHHGNVRRALEYACVTKGVVDGAKQPGFSAASWDPLRALVSVHDFVRVGNFKETMRWDEYVSFLTGWASAAEWDCSFKRITEAGGLVFLELEERSAFGEFSNSVNSLSVYEFTQEGAIRRIDVYLQMALPPSALPDAYEGVAISE
ncbi:hypothetical protein OG225_19755 [Nocardia sp. NBC_01377]|uniref:hypothetical protein n=1 Tax=Nocardia sp. NBC_01377 TaxID=2903595 RepID=UPI00324BF46B